MIKERRILNQLPGNRSYHKKRKGVYALLEEENMKRLKYKAGHPIIFNPHVKYSLLDLDGPNRYQGRRGRVFGPGECSDNNWDYTIILNSGDTSQKKIQCNEDELVSAK